MAKKKQLFPFIPILILLVVFSFVFFKSGRLKIGSKKISVSPTPTVKKETPSTYQISQVPYYGEKYFSPGASLMMALRFRGLTEEQVQQFKQILKTKGENNPADIFLGLEDLHLMDKAHLGFSSKTYQNPETFYRQIFANRESQITNFTNITEAYNYLKKLVSNDIPVIVIIQQGGYYVLVTGFDENYFYLSDPDPAVKQRKIMLGNFLAEWQNYKMDTKNIGFPGDFGMIWLEK